MKLEITVLRTGHRFAGPEGACGTCGWHPRAWTIAQIKRRETPEQAFLRANKNWTSEMLKEPAT